MTTDEVKKAHREGMFHCYPVFPVCKEAKDGWDLMIRRMKEEAFR